MSSVKLYIIAHCLVMLALVAGITLCAIHFNNYHLMWWYLLPVFFGGMEITSKRETDDTKK